MSTQSPPVFPFFNDITDSLPSDIQICGWAIKALLYADDIVLLAESPVELQTMINALHKYCLLWGLLVNTEKSKVLIFKRHWRRLPQNEKWSLGSIQLEIVKSYKYLGSRFTTTVVSTTIYRRNFEEQSKP